MNGERRLETAAAGGTVHRTEYGSDVNYAETVASLTRCDASISNPSYDCCCSQQKCADRDLNYP